MKKTVLVTGANGYIGSHVCLALFQAGYNVDAWDNHHYGQYEYNDISGICNNFLRRDITRDFVEVEYDSVIHLAGLTIVPESTQIPTEYYRVNSLGTANMLNRVHTNHFLFASTSSAWEMASPYARSKVVAEDFIKEKAKGYTIFRFFNVSGSNGKYRQLGPSTHLIRVAAEVAAGKRPYIEIFGNNYPTLDGTCIRDYVHVVDLARSIVEAVDRGPTNTPYECIGTNQGTSVKEVIEVMREVTGHEIPIKISERRPGDAVISVVDNLSNLIKLEKNLHDMCRDQYLLEKSLNH